MSGKLEEVLTEARAFEAPAFPEVHDPSTSKKMREMRLIGVSDRNTFPWHESLSFI